MKKILHVLLLTPLLLTTACSEDIDESNLYVSLEETIDDYLANRPEFSNFHYILRRVGYDKILSAYGQYTCFAPSNDGINEYIDSLYDDEVNLALPHNGMTVRGLEGLTDSLCLDIALFHLMSYCSAQNITFANYQGDELNCMGAYDFAIRMPPVPAGMYELRLGYSAWSNRGMVQIYMGRTSEIADMVPIDIPIDMRRVPSQTATETNPDPYTGWCDWTKCTDKGVESDQNMRYLGFMRAPMGIQPTSNGNQGTHSLRDEYKPLRRILAKQMFEQGEYWLRFKTMLPQNKGTMFHLDYIEFCPENVYNNAQYMEDMY